jgi:hypothetical protein
LDFVLLRRLIPLWIPNTIRVPQARTLPITLPSDSTSTVDILGCMGAQQTKFATSPYTWLMVGNCQLPKRTFTAKLRVMRGAQKSPGFYFKPGLLTDLYSNYSSIQIRFFLLIPHHLFDLHQPG